jgi:Polyketide cyclase / dehydrase and lipid transport
VKKFFNWILVLGACVGAFYLIGLIVPRNQQQGSKTDLQASPKQLYALVSDPTTWSAWHPDFTSVQERPERSDHPIWLVTDKHARTFELEVLNAEEPMSWQATYTVDETRFTLRFDFKWHGQGARACVARTEDTRDPWQRARRVLTPSKETSAIGILNAIAGHLGEAGTAEKNE